MSCGVCVGPDIGEGEGEGAGEGEGIGEGEGDCLGAISRGGSTRLECNS